MPMVTSWIGRPMTLFVLFQNVLLLINCAIPFNLMRHKTEKSCQPPFVISDVRTERVDPRAPRSESEIGRAATCPLRYLLALWTLIAVRHSLSGTHLQDQAQDGLCSSYYGQQVG